MEPLLEILGSYAFPIVACAALFWKMDKDQKTTQEYMAKRDELHREEINSLRESLDNNTRVIVKLEAKLGGKDDD